MEFRIGITYYQIFRLNPKNLTYIPSTCKHVCFHWYSFRFDTLIKSANSNIVFEVLDSRHVSRHKVVYAITTTLLLEEFSSNLPVRKKKIPLFNFPNH